MSISNFFTSYLFRKTTSGQTLYRPWGYLGPEYVVETESRRLWLQTAHNYWNFVGIAIVIIVALYDMGWVFYLIPPAFIIQYLMGRYLTRRMHKSKENAPLLVRMEPMVGMHSRGVLIFFFVTSTLILMLSVWSLFLGGTVFNSLLMLLGSLFMTIFFWLMIQAKAQLAQREKSNNL